MIHDDGSKQNEATISIPEPSKDNDVEDENLTDTDLTTEHEECSSRRKSSRTPKMSRRYKESLQSENKSETNVEEERIVKPSTRRRTAADEIAQRPAPLKSSLKSTSEFTEKVKREGRRVSFRKEETDKEESCNNEEVVKEDDIERTVDDENDEAIAHEVIDDIGSSSSDIKTKAKATSKRGKSKSTKNTNVEQSTADSLRISNNRIDDIHFEVPQKE